VLPFALLIPDMIINHIQRMFWPTPSDKIAHFMKNSHQKMIKTRILPSTPYEVGNEFRMNSCNELNMRKFVHGPNDQSVLNISMIDNSLQYLDSPMKSNQDSQS
jgi:hypothetical protein